MASEVYPPLKKLITTEFPLDILSFHILPRLPAKSVLRFKCVSKQWQSFLSTPMFKKMHLHHVTNDAEQKHLKLIVLSRTKKRHFCTLDCEEPELGLTVIRPLPFDAVYQRMEIRSSFRGLLCVGVLNNEYEYSDIILWNPVTGEYKILSKTNSQNGCYMRYGKAFELYYSSYDDDYKLLRVTNGCRAYIYSLKSDTWREVDFMKDFEYERPERMLSTWLNEKLYILLTFTRDESRQSHYSIIRFDLKTEKFNEIAAPSFERRTTCLSLTVQKGSIHLWVTNDNLKVNSMDMCREIELWRMGGDEKWTKVVSSWWKPFLTLFPQPLHIMKNGNWLMHTGTNRDCFYRLDMVKNKKHTLCSYNAEAMGICPRGKYIETFVSPTQYDN